MNVTHDELAAIRREQGTDRGLQIDTDEGNSALLYSEVNTWAFQLLCKIRAESVAFYRDRVHTQASIIDKQGNELTAKQKIIEDLNSLLDDVRKALPTADNTENAQWERSATDAGGPYRAHKTTDGWTVIDKSGAIVLWDTNGSGIQFANEVTVKRLAVDWNN